MVKASATMRRSVYRIQMKPAYHAFRQWRVWVRSFPNVRLQASFLTIASVWR